MSSSTTKFSSTDPKSSTCTYFRSECNEACDTDRDLWPLSGGPTIVEARLSGRDSTGALGVESLLGVLAGSSIIVDALEGALTEGAAVEGALTEDAAVEGVLTEGALVEVALDTLLKDSMSLRSATDGAAEDRLSEVLCLSVSVLEGGRGESTFSLAGGLGLWTEFESLVPDLIVLRLLIVLAGEVLLVTDTLESLSLSLSLSLCSSLRLTMACPCSAGRLTRALSELGVDSVRLGVPRFTTPLSGFALTRVLLSLGCNEADDSGRL